MGYGDTWGFTGLTKVHEGSILRQIIALKDLEFHGVKTGDYGGWVAGTSNLIEEAWVEENSHVHGTSVVSGQVLIKSYCDIKFGAKIKDQSVIGPNTIINSSSIISGNSRISNTNFEHMVMELHDVLISFEKPYCYFLVLPKSKPFYAYWVHDDFGNIDVEVRFDNFVGDVASVREYVKRDYKSKFESKKFSVFYLDLKRSLRAKIMK